MNGSGKIVQLVNPTNNQDAATKRYVDTSIPVGGIIMWSGANNTWPSNWRLCDGTNGTPNLQGRFVLSSGVLGTSTRNVGQTGGVETVALTLAQMPSHSHGVSARTGDSNGYAWDGAHGHPISDPGHRHQIEDPIASAGGGLWWGPTGGNGKVRPNTTLNTTGVSVGVQQQPYNQWPNYDITGTFHNHTITVSESSRGSGDPHENMPPFYVLAFIMRVS
jgi:microcystin-dependent protein